MPSDLFDPVLSAPEAAAVLSVSELNRLARDTLECALPLVRVRGEISNLARPASGHIYLTLKDEGAQVRCAMWRNRAQLLPFRPREGQRVEVRARVTLFEARGDYQLNIDSMREAGSGDLFAAFMQLKARLDAAGLFDPARKRAIPPFPRGIAVVTSLSAAALQDVLSCLRRRSPHLPVVVYPCAVQGEPAAREILSALQQADARHLQDRTDLILLVRGGGSIEDLWAFNDEALAYAISASSLPVIAGIGHETDFTIADFAADLRAPTPTAAAEQASAGYVAARHTLAARSALLQRSLRRRLDNAAQQLDRAGLRLLHPRERIARARLRLNLAQHRLQDAAQRHLQRAKIALDAKSQRLARTAPALPPLRVTLENQLQRLHLGSMRLLRQRRLALETLSSHLQHLDPKSVLRRGYSIVRDRNGQLLRRASDCPPETELIIELGEGSIAARSTQQFPPLPSAAQDEGTTAGDMP